MSFLYAQQKYLYDAGLISSNLLGFASICNYQ